MKKTFIFLLILTGCATHDQYKPYNDQTENDWRDCNHAAFHSYYTGYYEGVGGTGAVAGGVLLGPLGAALGGAAADDSTIKSSDIDSMRDRCMLARGYKKQKDS